MKNPAIYQIYLRSFQDSNGDGIGDLNGVRRRLATIRELGFDAIWLSPFYPSPQKDYGYDVANYCDVDPVYGSLADFDALLAEAHVLGLAVLIDFVLNHTSDQHPWFQEARHPDSPKRDWYVWRSEANSWPSFFGGPAWTLDPLSGQYYLHHFLPEQPDLNYRNPEVQEAILDVARFWFARGVDGLRLDAVWLLFEDPLFRDEFPNPAWVGEVPSDWLEGPGVYDPEENHLFLARLRQVARQAGDKLLLGEIWLPDVMLQRYYGTQQAPELQASFNFRFLLAARTFAQAEELIEAAESHLAMVPAQGMPMWVLGNHDVPRLAASVGEEMARTLALAILTLPGALTWYMGDELALPDGPLLAIDPNGREVCRTPYPWDNSQNCGFSEGQPWLAIPESHRALNLARAQSQSDSLYHLLKTGLELRAAWRDFSYQRIAAPAGIWAYSRGPYQIYINLSQEVFPLPAGEVLLTTRPGDISLPPGAAAVISLSGENPY